jgi:hypothetical protein
MRLFHVIHFFLLVSVPSIAQPVWKTMVRLPDTGQQISYTGTFGEDSDFLINMPGFIDNGDGTVTDTVTSLMWQRSDGPEMTFNSAAYFCDTLSLAGHADWRLPTAKEIYSILNHQRANPAIDVNIFASTTAEYWWSSDRQANDTSKIWCANAGGGIGNHRMSETISAGGTKRFQVRAVRETTAPLYILDRYTDLQDGTIVDSLSGLQWTKATSTDSITWEQALAFSDTLTTGGHADWRLPNIKELESLNDERQVNPSLPSAYFSLSTPEKYWSSTSLPNQTARAWYLDTRFGITTYDDKTLRHYVLCVRTYDQLPTNTSEADVDPLVFLYPNPFDAMLVAEGVDPSSRWDFYDLQGRVVRAQVELPSSTISMPAGTYLVQRSDGIGPFYRVVRK